jgi:hypothetical protein
MPSPEIEAAMERLRRAERARHDAITDLIKLGAVRSRTLVGDLGEQLAADYYGVELEPPSTPGFDLRRPDRQRVQVRTLRATPGNFRTTVGVLSQPYDFVFAIRLDQNYSPLSAIEVPRVVVEEYFGRGRVTWTKRMENDPRVRRIEGAELAPGSDPGGAVGS